MSYSAGLCLVVTFMAITILLKFFTSLNHLLVSLLTMEALMLINFTLMVAMLGTNSHLLSLTFITFAVMEASLGLASLIQLSRSSGNDALPVLYSFKLTKLLAFKAEIATQSQT